MLDWQPIDTLPKSEEVNGKLLVWITTGEGLLSWDGKPYAEFAYWVSEDIKRHGGKLCVFDYDGDTVPILNSISHWAIINPPT